MNLFSIPLRIKALSIVPSINDQVGELSVMGEVEERKRLAGQLCNSLLTLRN